MTVLAMAVGGYAVALVATGFQFVAADIAGNRFPTALGLRTHIVASGLAMLVGPWQFLRPLRNRIPGCTAGWAGPTCWPAWSAVWPAGRSPCSPPAGWWPAPGSCCWPSPGSSARAGVPSVRAHDYRAHQRWMIRSFALTFAAVTLRLYLPISMIAGFDFAVAYR